jgi:hypothetical protein
LRLLRAARNDRLASDGDGVVRLSVCKASILTGYFESSMRPMLCIDGENRIVPPTEKLDANLPPVEKFQFGAQWVFAGVIEATDEEIAVLRGEGGYQIRDLRTESVSDLLAELA